MSNPPRPLPFVLVASEQGTLIVNHLDHGSPDPGSNFGVGCQILNQAYFDPAEVADALNLLELQRNLRGEEVVALDCGANIGVHTISWARRMTGWGRVLAFEAQERLYYALAGNICLNNCFNARALHAALGETDGFLDIPVPEYRVPASFGSLELRRSTATEDIGQYIDYSPTALEQVRMLSIDGLRLPRVDLIKIDVEGMELEVLAGAKDTIARCRPIMLVEYIKCGLDNLVAVLDAGGYTYLPQAGNLMAIPKGDPAEQRIRLR